MRLTKRLARLARDPHSYLYEQCHHPRHSMVKTCCAAIGFTLWCVSLLTSPAFTSSASAQDSAPAPSHSILICTNQANAIHLIAADFIVEAYKRIGCDVEFIELPNRRSLMQADDGSCDGETIRIGGLEKSTIT